MTKDIDEYLDDNKRLKRLQQLVDEVCEKIKRGELTLGEAKKEAALVRLKAEKLIPYDMEKFDLIYASRLNRMIEQYLLPKLKDDPMP
jgi:hypothetical protein